MSGSDQVEFAYRAIRAGREERGLIRARNERDAMRRLIEQELSPIELRLSTEGPVKSSPEFLGKVKQRDIEQLFTEIATLLKAGVSMDEVLESLLVAYGALPVARHLKRMRDAIRSGGSFLDGLKASSLPLAPYTHALIAAGEASGELAEAIAGIAVQMTYEREVRNEFRNALIYPAILVVTGILVIGIVFVAVVPRFATLLKGGKANIPDLSRWVIEAGVFVKTHLPAFGFGLLGAVIGLLAVARAPEVRRRLVELGYMLPLLGAWLKETDVGRWATLMGALLANRVPILKAIDLSADAFRLDANRRKAEECARDLRKGIPLSEAVATTGWLGPTQLNLLRVGERSGELPRMLHTLGELQTGIARQRMKRLLIVIEPVAILLIGGIVGFLMVAVMMALTGLSANVG